MPMSVRNYFQEFRADWQRSFFVALFFVTIAALLFWLDTFHVYQSDIRILVIGKVPTVATDQVVENFAELSRNLSFYEQVLAGNDLIDDDFDGYSKDERKKLWNETVTVTRSDKSGVLVVSARQDSPEKATRLAEATVQTLFATASFYYNIKTDIDLRIVDESIVKTTINNPIAYVTLSIFSAGVVTITFFGILSVIPFFFGRRTKREVPEFPIGASVPFIDPQKFVPERPTLSFESSHQEQQTFEEIEENPSSPTPSNERMLPGMDATELPFQFEASFPDEEVIDAKPEFDDLPVTNGLIMDTVAASEVTSVESVTPEIEVKKGEPTIEEYKRRLNELLAGGK